MESLLGIIVVLLVVSVGTVAAARALKLPPLVGYLVVGLLLGPHALALAPDTDVTRWLAEIGVVFLMFSIGLEFSLPKLRAMRSLVFGLGAKWYSGHSLRSGGATDLFVQRVPYFLIKKMGRWKSEAAMIYYRCDDDVRQAVAVAFDNLAKEVGGGVCR